LSLRIAIVTNNNKGLEDTISKEFGHSKTFTIIEIEEKEIKDIKIIQNPANKFNHGKRANNS
jgi:predicted Fe-Mo cluster-binding NifX family protein